MMPGNYFQSQSDSLLIVYSSLTNRLRYQAESRGVSRQPYFLGVPVLSPSVASYSTLVEVWSDLDPQRATEIVDRMTDCGLAPAYQVNTY